ncbi:MAG TPA: hypothetical protein VI485_21610 [Vicinamibacterales bacterium]|nr:hypothetical protein [Vicinamibacterales bacterium]
MRTLVIAALIGTALVAVPSSQTTQNARVSDSLERAFPTNGRIRMDLSAGEYRISGSKENRVRLQWRVRNAEELSQVRTRIDVRDRNATILTDGPNHFKVDIQVPARADLHVRLTAGELTVDGIEGNKDIGLHAGELDIDVGRAEDYKSVSASVWAGELHATPYNENKEGLFRSFDWTGKGPYRLEARLKAGEVRLHANRR